MSRSSKDEVPAKRRRGNDTFLDHVHEVFLDDEDALELLLPIGNGGGMGGDAGGEGAGARSGGCEDADARGVSGGSGSPEGD